MNEKQLILGCLEGEAEAFREIMDRYKTKAMALAMNMLGNRENTEEARKEFQGKFFSALDQTIRGLSRESKS